MNIELSFGEWLQDHLVERDLRQQDLAELLGADQSSVSDWVNDKTKPGPRYCDAIAGALGLDRNEVRRRAGRRPVSVTGGRMGVEVGFEGRVQVGRTGDAAITEPVVFLPVLGPLPADSVRRTYGIGETYPMPASKVRDIQSPAMYVVSGDCLLSRGLRSGDLVLLDRRAAPRPGDIVAVRVGDDHTLKEWWPDEDGLHVTLRASEPGYRPTRIRLDDEGNELIGVYRGGMRWLNP
jgi:SOS-response transcriptional repressor LexA